MPQNTTVCIQNAQASFLEHCSAQAHFIQERTMEG